MPSQTQIDYGYSNFLEKHNLNEIYIRELMEHLPVPIPNALVDSTFSKRPSPIHGVGMFAVRKINCGEVFPMVKNEKRFNLARFVNHKDSPNLRAYVRCKGELCCEALIDISKDEEVTMDYSDNKAKSEENI